MSLTRAVDYVRARVNEGTWPPGQRLPPLIELARQAGVCRSVMWQAVRVLRSEGVVSAARGRGTFVGALPATRAGAPGGRRDRWQAVRSAIEKDLYQGAFRSATALPSHKELTERYGVNHRTLAKALRALVAGRVLAPHGRSYRVAHVRHASGSGTVLFLTQFGLSEVAHKQYTAPSLSDLVRCMEEECTRSNVLFRPVSTGDRPEVERHLRDRALLGAIVYEPPVEPEGLLNHLFSAGKPVAVFDNYVDPRPALQRLLPARGLLHLVRIDESGAGGDVARFLMDLGHHQAAFVSPFHGNLYSRMRHEGLQAAFRSAGLEHAVRHCVSEQDRRTLHLRTLMTMRRRRERGASGSVVAVPAGVESGVITETVRFDESFYSLLRQEDLWYTFHKYYEAELGAAMAPMLEDLVARDCPTALVCVDDSTALQAVRFLRQRRVDVPRAVSVVGYDNSLDASYAGLTSYSFDITGVVLRMLQCVLRPARPGVPASERLAMVHGMVIPRETTGAAQSG